ncbi:MAG TPA: hypothetical protein VGS22_29375 [Thermoanaerobaculia bacterium]|jgi:hypothetical protein|nr:hypothetical protein [Thermoanaerobaculia bacterium]
MLAPALERGATERPKPERLRLALEEFFGRSTRRWHPEGEWQDGLWYPSAGERQTCCEGIEPSKTNRQALESHCRKQAHVAALYGLPVGEVKAAVRDDRKRGSPIAQQVASSFVGPRPPARGAGAFADMSRRAREEAFERLRAVLADSLPLFERLHALVGVEGPDEAVVADLLERAIASAERLVASLNFARNLEASLARSTALLETLQAMFEEPRQKRRRASAVPPVIGGESGK